MTAGPVQEVGLFAILSEPGNGYGGNSVQARVILDNPAPVGGAVVTLATDIPQVQLPVGAVTIPAGKTDATIAPVATGPVPNYGLSIGIIGDVFASLGNGRQQNSLGVLPILFGTGLSNESVVGGATVTGTVTLFSPAPPGGLTVRLVSSNTSLVQPPASVFIPAGVTGATFSIPTSGVSVATRVIIDSGTEIDGYRAPEAWLLVTPPGSPTPAASLSSLTLSQSSVLAGGTVTGTVTLTSPAPAGGAVVILSASMEGQVIVPPNVTVPAGALSASFTTTPAPQTVVPRWVLVQARYGTSGGTQARILEVDPAPGAPTLFAIGPASQDVVGGNPGRASVALVMPAPAGGGVVSLFNRQSLGHSSASQRHHPGREQRGELHDHDQSRLRFTHGRKCFCHSGRHHEVDFRHRDSRPERAAAAAIAQYRSLQRPRGDQCNRHRGLQQTGSSRGNFGHTLDG